MGYKTAADIRERFERERRYVSRYLAYLDRNVTLSLSDLQAVSHTARVLDLGEIPVPRDWWARRRPSYRELKGVLDSFPTVLPKLDAEITAYSARHAAIKRPDRLEDVDVRSSLGELIEYLTETLGDSPSADVIENARRDAIDQIRQNAREYGEDPFLGEQDVQYAIESAQYLAIRRRFTQLLDLKDRLQDIELAVRISRPHSEINIHRQAFLLLMTAFDAAVFDIVRVALRTRFFELIGTFARQDKLALESLSRHASFDTLREEIIETQLKGRYLRDLVLTLRDLGLDANGSTNFAHLVELILRRNVHIHNRGYVDEKYLDRDRNSQPQYNVFNLSLGDPAKITKSYWDTASRICSEYVSRLTGWAEHVHP